MKKKVLMIGCGVQEQLAVSVVEREGYGCIVTDKDVRGRKFDCPCYRADGLDLNRLAQITRLEEVSGIFTFTEMVESVASVAQSFRLPGVSIDVAAICQDKGKAGPKWHAARISTPLTRVITVTGDSLLQPSIGSGGEGIVRLEEGLYVIRKEIDGTDHDINGLFHGGQFLPLGISDRFFDSNYQEIEVRIPTVLTQLQQQQLYSLVEAGARALGITWGPVKADAVFDGERFYLLEMAPRLHGPRSSLMAWPATGFEPLVPGIHVIAGDEPVRYEVKPECCVIGRTVMGGTMCSGTWFRLGGGKYFVLNAADSFEQAEAMFKQ